MTDDGPADAIDDDTRDRLATMPWSELMGFEMLDADRGRVTLGITPRHDFHNQNGTVAAPISFARAEATGVAVVVMDFLDRLDRTYTVVKEADLRFVAAARGPIRATATIAPTRLDEIRAAVDAGEPVDEPLHVDVLDGTDRVVLAADMVMAVRPLRTD